MKHPTARTCRPSRLGPPPSHNTVWDGDPGAAAANEADRETRIAAHGRRVAAEILRLEGVDIAGPQSRGGGSREVADVAGVAVATWERGGWWWRCPAWPHGGGRNEHRKSRGPFASRAAALADAAGVLSRR